MLTKCLGGENSELFFRVVAKSIWGPCNIQTIRATGKTHCRDL